MSRPVGSAGELGSGLPLQLAWGAGMVRTGGSCRGSPGEAAGPVFQCFIRISAAYGSTKDISVYSVLGLPPSQIFIVGRPAKKYQTQCQVGQLGVACGSGSGC